MEYLLSLFVFIFGLLVGSFLSVLVHRHGFNESRRSRSSCSSCHKELSWYELFPVISYIFLKGKCKTCGSALSKQDPLIEIATGVIFLSVFLSTPVFYNISSLILLGSLLLFWGSFIVLTAYDLKHTLVPYSFVIALIGSSILVRVLDSWIYGNLTPMIDGLIGGLVFGGFILLLVLITKGKGMGFGDVYVALAVGMFFGVIRGFEVIAISFWAGAIIGLLLILLQKVSPSIRLPWSKAKLKMKSEVPFVPFIFLGALIGAFTTFSPLVWFGSIF